MTNEMISKLRAPLLMPPNLSRETLELIAALAMERRVVADEIERLQRLLPPCGCNGIAGCQNVPDRLCIAESSHEPGEKQ